MNRRNHFKKRPQREIEYIPTGSKEALATLVSDMGLHPKTKELFEKNGIVTAMDVAKRNSKQLFKIQGFGKKDLIGVERELGKLGLTLAPLPEIKETPKQETEEKVASEKTVKQEPKEEIYKQERPIQEKPKQEKQKQDRQERRDKKPQKNEKDKRDKNTNEFKRISVGGKIGLAKGGETVIPAEYGEVFMPKEDMVCVDVDGLFGYVNMQNEMIIEPKYELAQSFSMGVANVMLNDKYGYIDKTGKEVIPFKYELATPFEEDGTARVKQDGRWAIITLDEKITWI